MTEEEKAALAFQLKEENYQSTVSQEQQVQEEAAANVAPVQPPQPQPETPPQPPVTNETPPQVETPQEQGNSLQGFIDKGKEVIGNAYADPLGTVLDVQQKAREIATPGLLGNQAMASNPIAAGLQAVTGQSLADFGMDAVGNVPGLGWVDDQYDEKTKWENPKLQKVRGHMSVIVPSVLAGVGATYATGGVAGPAVVKGLAVLGTTALADVAVTGLSDQSETEDNFFAEIHKWKPEWNIPENFRTMDGDSPEVRTEKHLYDSIGFSFVGEVLGVAMQASKPIMRWMKPLNKTS